MSDLLPESSRSLAGYTLKRVVHFLRFLYHPQVGWCMQHTRRTYRHALRRRLLEPRRPAGFGSQTASVRAIRAGTWWARWTEKGGASQRARQRPPDAPTCVAGSGFPRRRRAGGGQDAVRLRAAGSGAGGTGDVGCSGCAHGGDRWAGAARAQGLACSAATPLPLRCSNAQTLHQRCLPSCPSPILRAAVGSHKPALHPRCCTCRKSAGALNADCAPVPLKLVRCSGQPQAHLQRLLDWCEVADKVSCMAALVIPCSGGSGGGRSSCSGGGGMLMWQKQGRPCGMFCSHQLQGRSVQPPPAS